jgi:hypothetical protein
VTIPNRYPVVLLALSLALATTASSAAAQVLSLDSLRPPASPAFVLLGISPSDVQKPSAPRAVSANFLGAAQQAGGVPMNYAVEFAPYWLVSRPTLTLAEYERNDLVLNIQRTFSFSFATAEREAGADGKALPGTRFGLGFRALPLKGRQSDSVRIYLGQIRVIQAGCLNVDDIEGCLEAVEDSLRGLALGAQRTMRDRYGMTVEVAGGATFDYPDNEFDAGRRQRLGVWMTPSYRPANSPLRILGVARYLLDRDDTSLDLGGRLYWELDQLAISGEMVERWAGEENTRRVSGTVEFQISKDLYATYTFGRNFEPVDQSDGPRLISILGLNVGIGKEPTLRAQ